MYEALFWKLTGVISLTQSQAISAIVIFTVQGADAHRSCDFQPKRPRVTASGFES